MHAPDAADLRPGDVVKLRGTLNTAHTGARAIVVGTHRDPAPPHEVTAIEVRYSARGVAIRVDLDGPGDLVRYEDPWPAAPSVPHTPAVAGGAAPEVTTRVPRWRIAATAVAVVVPVLAFVVWHQSSDPEQRYRDATDAAAAAGGVSMGTAKDADASDAPQWTATPTPTSSATGRVVAYSEGPVPVVVDAGTEPHAVPLAGITPVEACSAEYAHDLLELLPVGQPVTVVGAGWYRTDGGIDVNTELVRQGFATPTELPGTLDATDAANYSALLAAVPQAPADCA